MTTGKYWPYRKPGGIPLYINAKSNHPPNIKKQLTKMYRQIDGVAMGSPLGPVLENIFVGYYESKLFNKILKPTVYYRYVDDIFFLFHKETEFQKLLTCLNSLHPSLKFNNEIETNNSLPFLNVLITKSNDKFIASVYRKPTFTGQYIHWNSFGSKQRKTNLIDTLTH